MSSDLSAANDLAEDILAIELPRRHAHVVGVGRQAVALAEHLPSVERHLVAAAGFLHDIGYALPLQDTGFHPIDGARYLRSIGYDPRVINLVAHHSCAYIEAALRGLDKVIDREFPLDQALPHDAVCYCDMTTTPDGHLTTVEQRLNEVQTRYGPGSVVYDFVVSARQELVLAVRRVEANFELGVGCVEMGISRLRPGG